MAHFQNICATKLFACGNHNMLIYATGFIYFGELQNLARVLQYIPISWKKGRILECVVVPEARVSSEDN